SRHALEVLEGERRGDLAVSNGFLNGLVAVEQSQKVFDGLRGDPEGHRGLLLGVAHVDVPLDIGGLLHGSRAISDLVLRDHDSEELPLLAALHLARDANRLLAFGNKALVRLSSVLDPLPPGDALDLFTILANDDGLE